MVFLNLSHFELRKNLLKAKKYLRRLHDSKTYHSVHKVLGEASVGQLSFTVYLLHLIASGKIQMSNLMFDKLTKSKLKNRLSLLKDEDTYLKLVKRKEGSKFVRKYLMRYLRRIQSILPVFMTPFFNAKG